MALRTRIHRVVMHVAIALGASVQPFTKITPNVNNTVMHKIEHAGDSKDKHLGESVYYAH